MKKIVFIIVFIVTINNTFGQSIVWEVLNLGYSFGLSKDENGYAWTSKGNRFPFTFSLGSELRMKLLDNRLSPGLQFSFSGWGRYTPDGDWMYHQFAFSYMGLCDYNFLKVHSKFTPFAGMAMGVSRVRYDEDYNIWFTHFACSPRVGIDYKRIRLAVEYKYLGNRNNYFNIRLGFVIGS